MMPDIDGFEVIRQLKDNKDTRNIPVIFVSALGKTEDEARGLELGAVDYISKPFSIPVVMARIRTHLELKAFRDNLARDADERSMELDLTLAHLKKAYMELNEVHNQIRSSWIETIYRLTKAAEYKDEETEDHIRRVGLYTRELAQTMGMDKEFVDAIYYSAPIHDIGKVGIPDEILLKPANLTPEETKIIKSHTIIGARILEDSGSSFLDMARDIALSHHERWNGTGYPFGLTGEDIPLAGRIMNIVDQYDALRSRRPFKSSFSHTKAFEIITRGDGRTSPEDFDPAVLEGFIRCAAKFNEIYHTLAD
ncbi:MAG: HD domain-containing protein [Desulfobulbaceae bacterium]|nr:HD domain-containing protein [Desulfobulbaceae bacterium]